MEPRPSNDSSVVNTAAQHQGKLSPYLFSYPSCSDTPSNRRFFCAAPAAAAVVASSALDSSSPTALTPRAAGLSLPSSAMYTVEGWPPPRRRATRDHRNESPLLPHDRRGQIERRWECGLNTARLLPERSTTPGRNDVPWFQERANVDTQRDDRVHAWRCIRCCGRKGRCSTPPALCFVSAARGGGFHDA